MMYVEVKGAKASSNSHLKKRKHFDNGHLKTHFGRAIVKIFDDIYKNPLAKYAIAHPDEQPKPWQRQE